MSNKAQLVDAVKNMQRADPTIKQAWWDLCDQELGGVKDPNRHEESVLENFLSMCGQAEPEPLPRPNRQLAKGGPPRGGGGKGGPMGHVGGHAPMAMAPMGGASDMVNFIKFGQKMSGSFKESWQTYCGMYGEGMNDPARHDPSFIITFIDYLGQLGKMDLNNTAQYQMMQQPMMHRGKGAVVSHAAPRKRPMDYGMKGGGGEPPMKRNAVKGGGPVGGGGGGHKEELVAQVKNLQRRDPETKAAWWAFTDEHHGGIHDPNRHAEDILQEFLSMHDA